VTIRKGEQWGTTRPTPGDVVDAADDRAAAIVIGDALERGQTPPPVRLGSGDLVRTVGGHGVGSNSSVSNGPLSTVLPIDVLEIDLGGVTDFAVAHVAMRSLWWIRSTAVVMNAAYLGDWNLAPRSHPDDGRAEHLEGRLSLSDWWLARDRMRSGSHLPHPSLTLRSVSTVSLQADRPTSVWLDGRKVAKCTEITVRVRADAARLVI
jgi:hypothetical protein